MQVFEGTSNIDNRSLGFACAAWLSKGERTTPQSWTIQICWDMGLSDLAENIKNGVRYTPPVMAILTWKIIVNQLTIRFW